MAGAATFQINNPRKGTFGIPGTSYSITLNNVTKTTTDWTASGGIIVYDLGINGGSQTAWYKYRPTRDRFGSTSYYNGLDTQSGVTGDTGVHGTLQSPGNLYNLSYMTFCYKVLTASITASVFHDKDKSGTFNTGDANLAGWRVFLDSGSPGNGTYDAGEPTGQTGANGSYVFTVAPGASYRVCEELLSSAWFASTPVCTTVGPVAANGSATASFGDYQKATITASTYWDKDGGGSLTAGTDVPQTGWTVFIDGNGNHGFDAGEATGSTTAGGTFQFPAVDPGTYSVCEVVQSGWTNSDPGGAFACKSTGALLSQGTAATAFGNNQKVSIGGRVFGDDNANALFDGSETGLSTTVTVYPAIGGPAIATQSTAADGTYTFTGLNTGFGYKVCAVAPIGAWNWSQTLPGAGALTCAVLEFPNPAVVSNLLANVTTANIGAQKQASISGTVFDDHNKNSAADTGEGAAGWRINLYKDGFFSTFTTSGTGGAYSFAGLPAASSYRVCVVPPDNTWTQTLPTSNTVTCGGANEFTNGYGYTPLATNRVNVTNFGGVVLASVGGSVFYDTNESTVKDAGELGLAWTVNLYQGATLAGTTTAAASGTYQFTAVPIGNYRVCVVPASGRWKQTTPGADPNAACGASELARGIAVALTASGKSNADFGSVQIADISGTVFEDSTDNDGNFDGIKQPSENWYAGATVRLYDSAGVAKGTATTDSNGAYTFADKNAGDYVVCLATISQYGLVKPTAGDPADQASFPKTPGSVGCVPAAGNFSQAYGVTLGASNSTGSQFGIVAGSSACSVPFPFERYVVKLAGGVCKDGQIFTSNYDDTGNKLAEITPVRHDLPPVPMVERILWSIPSDKHQLKIIYDDIPPYSRSEAQDMAFCKIDPRDHTLPDDGITLLPAYWPMSSQGAILPTGQTSCLIEVKALVAPPSGGQSDYAFFVYSSVDGWRSTP